MDMKVSKKKLGLKEKYKLMTRDLGWEPTYHSKEEVFPTWATRASRSTTGTNGKTPSA
jgi:phenol hydroxylase P3 protein